MKISLMALVAGFCLVVGFPLAATAGPTPGGANSDGDSVENAFDNCSAVVNGEQKDNDHDGCGDACDADYNQDGAVTATDFSAFKATFLKSEGDPGYNANVDSNCDGSVTSTDFSFFKAQFLGTPGPSGFPATQRDATACP